MVTLYVQNKENYSNSNYSIILKPSFLKQAKPYSSITEFINITLNRKILGIRPVNLLSKFQ